MLPAAAAAAAADAAVDGWFLDSSIASRCNREEKDSDWML